MFEHTEIAWLKEELAALKADNERLRAEINETRIAWNESNEDRYKLRKELSSTALKSSPALTPEFEEQCLSAAKWLVARYHGINEILELFPFIRAVESWTEPAKEPDLLPCPCGNKNVSVIETEDDCGREWEISCSDGDCPWIVGSGIDKEKAVEYWNKRGDDAEFAELCLRAAEVMKTNDRWRSFCAAVERRYGGEAKT